MLTNRWGEAWQRRKSALRRGALVLHEGRIILRVETSPSSRHICDISRAFTDRLRIDGRPRRHDTRCAGLGDGSKNAVERCLKANHLALHHLVEGVRQEEKKRGIELTTYWPSRRDRRLETERKKV